MIRRLIQFTIMDKRKVQITITQTPDGDKAWSITNVDGLWDVEFRPDYGPRPIILTVAREDEPEYPKLRVKLGISKDTAKQIAERLILFAESPESSESPLAAVVQ